MKRHLLLRIAFMWISFGPLMTYSFISDIDGNLSTISKSAGDPKRGTTLDDEEVEV